MQQHRLRELTRKRPVNSFAEEERGVFPSPVAYRCVCFDVSFCFVEGIALMQVFVRVGPCSTEWALRFLSAACRSESVCCHMCVEVRSEKKPSVLLGYASWD